MEEEWRRLSELPEEAGHPHICLVPISIEGPETFLYIFFSGEALAMETGVRVFINTHIYTSFIQLL